MSKSKKRQQALDPLQSPRATASPKGDAFSSTRGRGAGTPLMGAAGDGFGSGDAVGAHILMQQPSLQPVITEKDVARGAELLTEYKNGKTNLELRIREDELWYQIRHWEALRRKQARQTVEPTSAWLFNSIINKHADAMDNYPRPNVLPRERSDETAARELSSILPCILEANDFEQVYSDNWWEKLKHGTGAYFVGWNKDKENGLGDIEIRALDLMNIFWEPGITDIQSSRNLFIVDLVDKDVLEAEYPRLEGKNYGDVIDVAQYVYDDTVDNSKKAVVVDWYYKIRGADGGMQLHMIKFVGSTLLYASQNDPQLSAAGLYAHGEYPVVFDSLYPEKGTPVGFGMISVCKDPQLYIDKLSGAILQHTVMAATPRFWASRSAGVNKEQFLDWKEPLVEVEGSIAEEKLRSIELPDLDSTCVSVWQLKIDELKETSANRDVNSGSAGSGVTAAAAISALQEAGNKVSRDAIGAAYRAYARIGYLVIELIRQFYDVSRSFRISGQEPSAYEFMEFSNAEMADQPTGVDAFGNELVRRPVFDIRISAEKKSPFSQMTQNEYAKEFYSLGFFSPERAQETMIALSMMEFEGKDKVLEQVQQGQTLLNICQQMSRQMDQMAAVIQASTGMNMGVGGAQAEPGSRRGVQQEQPAAGNGVASEAVQSQKQNMTGYQQRLASSSRPDMAKSNNAVGMRSKI